MELFDFNRVKITDGYLYNKQELNRKVTINSVYDRFSDTGRIGAFDFSWKEGDPNKPHIFFDSDVAKWIEGAAYILSEHNEPELEARVESLIDRIEKNQCSDGYFNIYYTVCEPENRFTNRDCHELYCAGHLFEAAVAYARATGRERFLKCMERYADYIYKVFVIDKSAAFITPGHEEIELALFEMYKYTGNKKYFELAAFFLENRGRDKEDERYDYNQSHKPIREQDEAVGHAVRAVYLYSAMADYALETGDAALLDACKKLWKDVTERKMYVTGGLGSTHIGEAFTAPYDLPSDGAYTETCAGIGLMFFAKRMQKLENNARYADIIERVLYNGVLSGLSIDGKSFFYENPLEINLSERFSNRYGKRRFPQSQRSECFSCSCCPPNINRLLPKLSEYIYGLDGDTLFVNQYTSSKLSDAVKCETVTDYPIGGSVKIKAEGVKRVALRIPSWCDSFSVNSEYELKDGYAYVENCGEIELSFDMTPFAVHSDSRVIRDVNKLCVQAGPIVYCAESIDNGENLHAISISESFSHTVKFDENIGLNVLEISALRTENSDSALYSRNKIKREPVTLKLIPYSAFANRAACDMSVWLNAAL